MTVNILMGVATAGRKVIGEKPRRDQKLFPTNSLFQIGGNAYGNHMNIPRPFRVRPQDQTSLGKMKGRRQRGTDGLTENLSRVGREPRGKVDRNDGTPGSV